MHALQNEARAPQKLFHQHETEPRHQVPSAVAHGAREYLRPNRPQRATDPTTPEEVSQRGATSPAATSPKTKAAKPDGANRAIGTAYPTSPRKGTLILHASSTWRLRRPQGGVATLTYVPAGFLRRPKRGFSSRCCTDKYKLVPIVPKVVEHKSSSFPRHTWSGDAGIAPKKRGGGHTLREETRNTSHEDKRPTPHQRHTRLSAASD